MARSSRLPLRHVKQVFYLVSEVADPCTGGLCRRTGARVGLTVDLQDALPGRLPKAIDPVDVGFADERERGAYTAHCASERRHEDPSTPAIVALHRHRRPLVAGENS